MPRNEDITITLRARNLLKKGISSAKKGITSIKKVASNVFGAFSKIVKGAGVGALVAFAAAYKSVQAALAQRAIFRKLESTIENTGASYAMLKGEINAVFESQQRLTNFGDDESAKTLSTLIQISGDYTKSLKALAVTQDLTASGLMSTESAAKAVGRAIAGDIEGLSRYIPSLKASNNAQLLVMTSAEKTEFALSELEKKFGGLAQASADPITQLKNEFGDMVEAIGDGILTELDPELKQLQADFAEFTKSGQFKGMVTDISEITAALIDMGRVIAPAFKSATEAIAGTAQVIKDLKSDTGGKGEVAANILEGVIDFLPVSGALKKGMKKSLGQFEEELINDDKGAAIQEKRAARDKKKSETPEKAKEVKLTEEEETKIRKDEAEKQFNIAQDKKDKEAKQNQEFEDNRKKRLGILTDSQKEFSKAWKKADEDEAKAAERMNKIRENALKKQASILKTAQDKQKKAIQDIADFNKDRAADAFDKRKEANEKELTESKERFKKLIAMDSKGIRGLLAQEKDKRKQKAAEDKQEAKLNKLIESKGITLDAQGNLKGAGGVRKDRQAQLQALLKLKAAQQEAAKIAQAQKKAQDDQLNELKKTRLAAEAQLLLIKAGNPFNLIAFPR